MRNSPPLVGWFVLFVLPTLSMPLFGASAEAPGPVVAIDSVSPVDALPRATRGRWVTRVQLVWDEAQRELTRKALTAWNNFGDEALDFLWLPDGGGVPAAGHLSGTGRLVWRQRHTSTADRTAVVAVYRGALRDGKAHGRGTFHHAGGFTYEGDWDQGLMHGDGRLTSPLGSVYTGRFEHGLPHGDSELADAFGHRARLHFERGRAATPSGGAMPPDALADAVGAADALVPLARAPYPSTGHSGVTRAPSPALDAWDLALAPVQSAGASDVRVGIFVAPPFPDESWMQPLEYAASNEGDALVVRPGNADFLLAWLGTGSDRGVRGVSDAAQGLMWGGERNDAPVEFRIAVRNDSNRKLSISGGVLRVRQSTPVLNPLVNIHVSGLPPGCRDDYGSQRRLSVSVEDTGWSGIDESAMSVRIGTLAQGSSAVGRANIGAVQRHLEGVDVTDAFTQVGVDAGFCGALHSCDTRSLGFPDDVDFDVADPRITACLENLRRGGRLGELADLIEYDYGRVFTHFVAEYAYRWRDHRGQQRTSSRLFEKYLSLTDLYYYPGGAEAGDAEPFKGNTVKLQVEGQNYAIRVPLRATVPAGQERSWSVLVSAPRSSSHEFVLELQTSAQRLSSRPVNLLYYRPNSWRQDGLPVRDTTAEPGRQWIQLASRKTPDEAKQIACSLRPKLLSSGLRDTELHQQPGIFRSMNDWYAIVAGPFPQQNAKPAMESLKARGAIARDALATSGERFINPLQYYCPR